MLLWTWVLWFWSLWLNDPDNLSGLCWGLSSLQSPALEVSACTYNWQVVSFSDIFDDLSKSISYKPDSFQRHKSQTQWIKKLPVRRRTQENKLWNDDSAVLALDPLQEAAAVPSAPRAPAAGHTPRVSAAGHTPRVSAVGHTLCVSMGMAAVLYQESYGSDLLG